MKKLFVCLFIFVLIITTNVYAIDSKTLYKQSVGSVVALTVMNYNEGCTGTGFYAIEPDIIVTCFHVVKDATSITAKDSSGNKYQIQGIIDYSESLDIAILKSSRRGKTLTFDANLPSPGTTVYALGNPLGLNFSFTNGMISQIQNLAGINLIQFTSPVSPGNSGGPILSENGKVLGVVSAYFTKGQNLNFAVPVAMLYSLNKSKTPRFEDNKLKKLYNIFMKDMVQCPAGSFIMGSPENELGHLEDEIQHKVTISKPFYIGKYEVTQSLYKSLMENNPSKFIGDNYPVERVTWFDAKEFCERLNRLFKDFIPKGYKFDLPTEAQWEYACRAGTTTSLNSGKNITSERDYCYNLNEVGWFDKNSNNKTHPIGQKKPNDWGIYDMHGNVWEWCNDWYGDYPSYIVTDPKGPNGGSSRVRRGGSWNYYARRFRSAYRGSYYPGTGYDVLGFRLAIVPVE